MTKLWCDLKTDFERVEFIRSGQAHDTGILAKGMEEDIASCLEKLISVEKMYNKLISENISVYDNDINVGYCASNEWVSDLGELFDN